MSSMGQVLFWTCAFIILYVYVGYPVLLAALTRFRPAPPVKKGALAPTVSLIVPAYNEEKVIAQKLDNVLASRYPADRLQVIVASDGSTDGTNPIVRRFAARGVRLAALEANGGKSAAENAAAALATGEILFFTDANVLLRPDAVHQIVSNFADPTVGCVVGRVTYINDGDTSVSEGEGSYWRYELALRRRESDAGNFAMGSGPIMALRRSLFRPLDPNVGEDFVLPMQVVLAGYRVVYEPAAVSEETLFQNAPRSMFKTKVRIISKDLRGLWTCRAILNPLRHPLPAWGLVSHKLLRWLVPYFLLAMFVANLFLLESPFYQLAVLGQVGFYGLSLAGYVFQARGKVPRLLGVPFSFCLVNLAALLGVARFARGKKSGRWQPVRDQLQREISSR